MVLSTILVLVLLLPIRIRRSKRRNEEDCERLADIPFNNFEIHERSAVGNTRSIQNPFELISVLLAMLLKMKGESEHNLRRAEKSEKEADLLKQEIKRMKREYEDKGAQKSYNNNNEMITGPSPSLFNEPLPTSSFHADDPFFEACGIRISLRGVYHPDTVTVQHSLPSDLEHFNNLRQEGREFDKTIKIGNMTINVHKTLLGARIPFFSNLLGPNFSESSSDLINLSSEYNAVVFECLIDWAYSGTLSINVNTVQDLMNTAAYLLLEEIVEDCYRFMRQRIEFDDALPLLYFCRHIGYNTNEESLMNFIESNFVPISCTSEFLDLSFDDLKKMIDKSSLHVDNEKQVFVAVDRWMENDENRRTFGPRLLELIRCNFLSSAYLSQTVVMKKWIHESPRCMDVINEALGIGKNSMISLNKTRRNSSVHNLILVTSTNYEYNINNDEFSRIEIYDPLKNEWHKGVIESHDQLHGVVVVGEEIVFMGHKYDENREEYGEGSMTMLNWRSNQWQKLSMPSLVDRTGGVYGVINDKIYSTGGDSLEPLTVFDTTNPSAGWTKLQGMKRCRLDAASCTLDGKLFVIGGTEIGHGNSYCNDGEFYDPEKNEWISISSMKAASTNSGAAALHGEIYLVGGNVRGSPSNMLQKYTPVSDKWTQLKSMIHPRSCPIVTASGDKLFVCGSWLPPSASKHVLFMDRYNPDTDTWVQLETMRELPNDPIFFSVPIPASFPTPNVEIP